MSAVFRRISVAATAAHPMMCAGAPSARRSAAIAYRHVHLYPHVSRLSFQGNVTAAVPCGRSRPELVHRTAAGSVKSVYDARQLQSGIYWVLNGPSTASGGRESPA